MPDLDIVDPERCPTCGARADEPCRTRTGHRKWDLHAPRERALVGTSAHERWANAVRAKHGLVRINASRSAPIATVQTVDNPPDTEDLAS